MNGNDNLQTYTLAMNPDDHHHQTAEKEPTTGQHYYHRPIIVLLFSFVAGITAGRFLPLILEYSLYAWLLCGACIAWLIRSIMKDRPASYAPLMLYFCLGWLAISSWLPPGFPPATVLPYIDSNAHIITGTVFDPPDKQGYRTRVVLNDLKLPNTKNTLSTISLPGKIQLSVYGKVPDIEPGDIISFNRQIRSIRNFNNPGGFNYRNFMAYKDIWGTAWDNGSRITISKSETAGSLTIIISRMRMTIDDTIASVSNGESRAVLSALIIGNKRLISKELRDSFNRSGVSHLLAISGLHIGIIATVTFFLSTAILFRSSFLLRHAMVKRAGALFSIFFVLGYGMIAGMSPSTQRAVIMICIFLLAYLLDRQHNPANTLAAAAMGILAISPHAIFNISFQLSFSAVGAIFIGLKYMPVSAGTINESIWKRIYRILEGFVRISLFAIIGTMPLVAYYFNQVTILGVISNLLLIPLIGFIVVPIGLLSAMLSFIFKPAALLGLLIADTLLNGSLYIVKTISAFPYGSFQIVTPSVIEIVCIYALLICLPMFLSADKNEKQILISGYARWPRLSDLQISLKTIIGSVIAITMIVLVLDITYWVHQRFFRKSLIVTFLDVGQGNAALIELPGGKTMMVDGGGFGDNSTFDVGELIVAPLLWRNKIRSIDKLILTHPHADHLNGLLYIMENFNVSKVISTHYSTDTSNYNRFLEIIRDRNIKHPVFSEIERKKNINGVDLHILHPPQNRTADFSPVNLNNGSIVLKMEYNGISFLFPGDMESVAETVLVDLKGKKLLSTILLSPHHGSNTSSTPEFLNAVNPGTVIISARKDRFGFPHDEVMDRYKTNGYKIFKTEKHGAIRIVVSGDRMRVIPTIPAAEGF